MGKFLDPMPPGFNPGPLDMEKPLDNQVALLKLQADLSGEPVACPGAPGSSDRLSRSAQAHGFR